MKKILLIEDNIDIRENTAEILELAQYEVITAENGKEGVRLAIKETPDLIICDIMMPVLDGHGVLHLLSKNEETAGIPFIFLTAKAERSDVRKGMAMGADDYLTKPFDDQELMNAIETRLNKQDLLKKKFTKSIDGVQDFLNEARSLVSLKELSMSRDMRHYKKKDVVFMEGAYPKGVYFINKGKIKVFQKNDQGKELISSLHKDGDFFGFLSLLKDEQYTHSAAVLEAAEIYMIPKEDFFSLIYKNAEVAKKFIGILSDNLLENEQQLIRLAYSSVRKRVAEALVKLSDTYKKETDQQFSMNVSREDLANLVGTAKETVIRTLSDFKEDKYIEITGSMITILEYEKLATMKN
ncbi:response regulator [Fluviicola taffensis]|uniref:Transcriptional regulator, Crp/Fnr family n=1 Tax=Fluviicola taffensis (strain DSM 16823 / NCIMB 13979 / RW262) TaxID=755732 RepID=F2I9J3_FLUTR|nr:response regulator [Fluviicola taffensis]AEA45174.1 transcriptional regulator, Crp/Fnr family [Fluviicola taffensis DSM 16823]